VQQIKQNKILKKNQEIPSRARPNVLFSAPRSRLHQQESTTKIRCTIKKTLNSTINQGSTAG
jgi:hypothetical protein